MACSLDSKEDYSLTAGYGRSTVQIHCAVHGSLDALWAQQTELIQQILRNREAQKPKPSHF